MVDLNKVVHHCEEDGKSVMNKAVFPFGGYIYQTGTIRVLTLHSVLAEGNQPYSMIDQRHILLRLKNGH